MPVDMIEPRQKLRDHQRSTRSRNVEVAAGGSWFESRQANPAPLWHVLHTRARQEKALTKTLFAAGIEHYLPLVNRVSFRGRQKCIIQGPLFASYLFLHGSVEATYFAIATKRVANAICVTDQRRFVQELKQIRLALDNQAQLCPSRYLEVGRRVRVMSGPFTGIEGLVEDRSKIDRLVLQIAAMGRATSLEIDADLLELVE